MRKVLEVGGILAAVVLIAFGIGAIIIGIDGKSTVVGQPEGRSRSSARPT